jgi:GTP-binding protein
LNQALQQIVQAHTVPLYRGKPVKFYYGTQTGTQPPTLTFFVNRPGGVPESYQRYLVNQLRQQLSFDYAPIRLHFRPRREEGRGKRS